MHFAHLPSFMWLLWLIVLCVWFPDVNACNVVSSFLIRTYVMCIWDKGLWNWCAVYWCVCTGVHLYYVAYNILYTTLQYSPACTYVCECMCVCVHIRTTYTAYLWLHDCLPFPPMNGMHAGDLPVVAEEFDTTLNIRDGYIWMNAQYSCLDPLHHQFIRYTLCDIM